MARKVQLVLLIVVIVLCRCAGQNCRWSTGEHGRCIKREKCLIPQVKQIFHGNLCENSNFSNLLICCPLLGNIVTPGSQRMYECPGHTQNYENKEKFTETYIYDSSLRASIVGGVSSQIMEFPHMAALGYESGQDIHWRCGGSLINDRFVLTAAHCILYSETEKLKLVRLGDANLRSVMDDKEVQTFAITRVYIHPKYAPPKLYHDIALIQLDGIVNITKYVKPACLHTSYDMPTFNLIATGWGRTQFTGISSEYLQKVSLQSFSHSMCKQRYYFVSNKQLPEGIVDDTQLCAGDINEQRDTCQGDSGGPLQVTYPDNLGIYGIVGITSFGKGCGVITFPGVYTRVSYFIPWIQQILWNNS